ncbi:MAG: SPASM domain-containing protein, partial [Firmicutes bacterium]|nr:SPASM domain-containing protein [Bacillota bacterium]
ENSRVWSCPAGSGEWGRIGAPTPLRVGPRRDRHRLEMGGRRFWLDVESGAVHELDEVAWDVLVAAEEVAGPLGGMVAAEAVVERLAGRHPAGEIRDALADLAALAAAGMLFPDPEPVSATAPVEMVAPVGAPALQPALKNLTLHMVHGCNLRCHYCLAGDGSYGAHGRMDADTARRAVDMLIASPEQDQTLEFSGGEPLLHFPLIQETTLYAAEQAPAAGKRLRFLLSTNGTLLDSERVAFLAEHRFRVVVSLDGRPATHDGMRPRVGGQGSYAESLAGARLLAAALAEQDLCLRTVFTRQNLDFASDVLHLADMGFRTLTLESVVADPAEPYALQAEDLSLVRGEYRKLTAALAERWRRGEGIRFLPFRLDPDEPFTTEHYSRGCGSGFTSLTVTPQGEIYPCHQFVGRPGYRTGRVETGIDQPALLQRFAAAGLSAKVGCADCWARYFCGGGCHANGDRVHGDILRPDELECELRKYRLECAFWLAGETAAA